MVLRSDIRRLLLLSSLIFINIANGYNRHFLLMVDTLVSRVSVIYREIGHVVFGVFIPAISVICR